MAPGQPTRADDEDLLNWLVLRDAGWPVALIAAVWRVPQERVALEMDAVHVADAMAHCPKPVVIGWDVASAPDRTVHHRVRT